MIYVYSQLCILQCMCALGSPVLYRRLRAVHSATVRLAAQLTTAISWYCVRCINAQLQQLLRRLKPQLDQQVM